eukprot:Gregarina_sp_Poly_1__8962@NODE_543_length_7587_cov_73_728590_g430_i0_p1_GENE_NODE_543_length_7587_cov_73_728590_g430_i0NODE_543_length_7587_cov_73_728590_g430_i0_p1_ORF_typecomplete_len727_score111_86SNF5/PF04855_12/2_1e05PBP1_TM/PF14812_6/1_1_NODE_543_length_7587_cov_73_728590_g430_i04432623
MVSDRKRHAPMTAGSGLMAEAQNVPGVGTYENQIYNEPWGQNEPDVDSDEDKIDRALAMEVNIPLDHKGELVTFREVRAWKVPTNQDLGKLKHRINEEWIKPLNLKQQDIVKASGLGAPYVCYLLKDPNSPNMNRRRKIEAYSVLTELFRKFDAKQVTREDFLRLKSQRLANRFSGPRQDRSGKNAAGAGRAQPRRRRRRNDAFGDEDDGEDDGSQLDDDTQDSAMRKRHRSRFHPHGDPMAAMMPSDGSTAASMSAAGMHLGGAAGASDYSLSPVDASHNPYAFNYGYMGNMGYGYGDASNFMQQQIPKAGMYSYQYMPMMTPPGYGPNGMGLSAHYTMGPMISGPMWPPSGYNPKLARGQGLQTDTGELYDAPAGAPFQAPYPPGFPPVTRTITSLPDTLVDGPPTTTVAADRSLLKSPTGIKSESQDERHDRWVRDKVSQLARPVVMPKSEPAGAVFREPITHSFVFLVEKDSCLLPIGVKLLDGPPVPAEELWDLKALRQDAEAADWLDEARDWDDCLWVLWDIRETGSAVSALLEKLRQDHSLNDTEWTKVAKCFLSQYVSLRDVELSFRALQEYANEREDFCRNIEINCDLLEERLRVRDSFYWDIRASDWDLTALLSNFVSDFELDSPAISSLFIDLKTTILRHRKDWVSRMLERLAHDGKIDSNSNRFLPGNLGFEPHQVQPTPLQPQTQTISPVTTQEKLPSFANPRSTSQKFPVST